MSLDGVNKTNGHGETDAYHVSYSFMVKVDPDKLEELGNLYTQESAAYAKFNTEYAAFNQKSDELKHRIENLRRQFNDSTPRPSMQDFSGGRGLSLSYEQEASYEAARQSWEAELDTLIGRLKAELAQLQANWFDTHGGPVQRTFRDPHNIGKEMGSFYIEGCPYQVVRLIGGIFKGVVNQADFFKRTEIDLQGKMTLHKTEQGWQPLGQLQH